MREENKRLREKRERKTNSFEFVPSPHLSFCSLFYDTDKYFGSVGSFWDYSAPDGGSFEVNPPFDPKSTQKCLEKMNQLLDDSDARGKAISFILVVPWR